MNKLLLIDDDEDDQFFFKEALESIDPTILCDVAINGKIAFDKLKISTTLPDLIFLDLNMPVMNGFDFLQEIKKENKLNRIPIGIFSTSNIISDRELTKTLGARFFLTKPTDLKILRNKIQDILSADFSKDEYLSAI
jgi:CheY-like chemotaxis protein